MRCNKFGVVALLAAGALFVTPSLPSSGSFSEVSLTIQAASAEAADKGGPGSGDKGIKVGDGKAADK